MTPVPIPVDSTDAREQREAERDRAEADQAERERHDRGECTGWTGEDPAGRPIPCLRCHPRLELHMPCSVCSVAWNACRAQSNIRRGPCCDRCLHVHRSPLTR